MNVDGTDAEFWDLRGEVGTLSRVRILTKLTGHSFARDYVREMLKRSSHLLFLLVTSLRERDDREFSLDENFAGLHPVFERRLPCV